MRPGKYDEVVKKQKESEASKDWSQLLDRFEFSTPNRRKQIKAEESCEDGDMVLKENTCTMAETDQENRRPSPFDLGHPRHKDCKIKRCSADLQSLARISNQLDCEVKVLQYGKSVTCGKSGSTQNRRKV